MSGAKRPAGPAPRVFVSYAHDSAEHDEAVRGLWTLLRSQGVDARLDLPAVERRQDWPVWMLDEVRAADFVLVIASPAYRRRAEGDASADQGRGVQPEAALIREELYRDRQAGMAKFLPVLLPGCSREDIPAFLDPTTATSYRVNEMTPLGAERLLRVLAAQPFEVAPPLGQGPRFAPAGTMIQPEPEGRWDVFLSHSHLDADWVEELATRLQDERGIHPWLDRWVLVPGKPWQREIARGLEQAASCAVCLGQQTPRGWFENEIGKALNRQAKDTEFRVIPVLLPGADAKLAETLRDTFLDLNTWVDFRAYSDPNRAFHLLVCGVKGLAPGRWTPPAPRNTLGADMVQKLHELRQLRQASLVDDAVALDVQRKIVEKLLGF